MSPDIGLNLTEQAFKSFEALLAAQGIKVCPKSKSSTEDLVRGGILHEEFTGILLHENCEFIYRLSCDSPKYLLTIEAFAHGNKKGESLGAAVERAFPQSERDRMKAVPQSPNRRFDKARIIGTLGCLGVLAFVLAVIYFAFVGFWKTFYK